MLLCRQHLDARALRLAQIPGQDRASQGACLGLRQKWLVCDPALPCVRCLCPARAIFSLFLCWLLSSAFLSVFLTRPCQCARGLVGRPLRCTRMADVCACRLHARLPMCCPPPQVVRVRAAPRDSGCVWPIGCPFVFLQCGPAGIHNLTYDQCVKACEEARARVGLLDSPKLYHFSDDLKRCADL